MQKHQQNLKDLLPSKSFFNPDLKDENIKGPVIKIQSEEYLNYDQSHIQKTFGKILDKVEPISSRPSPSSEKTQQAQQANWSHLNEQDKDQLNKYYQTLSRASILYTIVQSESKGKDLKSSPHFKEWQAECSTKNRQAYEILKLNNQEVLQDAVGKEAFRTLQERASKHEAILQKQISSEDFFNPGLKKESVKGQVIQEESLNHDQIHIQKRFERNLDTSEPVSSPPSPSSEETQPNWSKLTEKNIASKTSLDQYYQKLNQASMLYTLVLCHSLILG